MPFYRTGFQINLFLPLEAHCCSLFLFYRNFAYCGPWSATCDLGGITFRKIEGGDCLCFRKCFKNLPLHVYKFSFLKTSNTDRIFSNYFRPLRKPLVWETVVWSLWKKSRLFYTHNYFRKKNYSFIASRIEKMRCKYCENYVFLWKLSHSHVFFVLLYLVEDQGPSSTIVFFRITSKILKVGTCNFTIIERKIKAILRRYFSPLQFDPGYSW